MSLETILQSLVGHTLSKLACQQVSLLSGDLGAKCRVWRIAQVLSQASLNASLKRRLWHSLSYSLIKLVNLLLGQVLIDASLLRLSYLSRCLLISMVCHSRGILRSKGSSLGGNPRVNSLLRHSRLSLLSIKVLLSDPLGVSGRVLCLFLDLSERVVVERDGTLAESCLVLCLVLSLNFGNDLVRDTDRATAIILPSQVLAHAFKLSDLLLGGTSAKLL